MIEQKPLRRSYRRMRVRWEVEWNAFGRLAPGTVLDASATGMFIATTEPTAVRPGCRVQLFVTLPGRQRRAVTQGTVRWVGHSEVRACDGFGVELDHIELAIGAYLYGAAAPAHLERRAKTL